MRQKARLEKLVSKVKADIEERVFEFWKQFTLDELESIERGEIDPQTMEKFHRLGGEKMIELSLSVMTSEERAEYDKEIERLENEKN